MVNLRLAATLLLFAISPSHAFLSSQNIISRSHTNLRMSADGKLVIISPPGGVGEVAAIRAANMGSSVRWFVISPPSSTASVTLPPNTSGIEVAGAQADTLLLPTDDSSSAAKAVASWCSSASGIICVMDGVEQSIIAMNNQPGVKRMENSEVEKTKNVMMDAIKVAAKEASKSVSFGGMKVAVVSADLIGSEEEDGEEKGSGLLGGLLGGNQVDVPSSLTSAMGYNNLATLRYGDLFGLPESSMEASPFLGGPRKYPVLRDEYTMKGVRMDPSKSTSGNSMVGEDSRSSRFSVGEAAVRMATNSLNIKSGIDVCLISLTGNDELEDDEWADEFGRVQDAVEKSIGGELFSASFGSVPSVERLADWVATKWAPAVLKTYDIAGIRVGARPVYASRIGENQIEIIWQELKDFKTNFVGKMVIEISETGIVARRGAGDPSAGYGSVSSKPLNGEDILVRRLADAASQAMDKRLATKPAPTKRPKKKKVVQTPVVSTVVSSGAVDMPEPVAAKPAASETGPRTTGKRRSSEKKRGKRRKESSEDSFQ